MHAHLMDAIDNEVSIWIYEYKYVNAILWMVQVMYPAIERYLQETIARELELLGEQWQNFVYTSVYADCIPRLQSPSL